MSPRQKKKALFGIEQPGLFDEPAVEHTAESISPKLPVHPSIAAYASRVRLSGGGHSVMLPDDNDPVVDPLEKPHTMRPMMIMSLGSGSSGNCTYVGNGSEGFLIDAGIKADFVKETLLHNGIDIDSVKGIVITHDHCDHVHYAYTLLRSHKHMRVYCTPKTLNGMLRRHSLSRRIKDYHTAIYKEFPFKIGPFELTAFEVSHDGTDNAGYFISYGNQHLCVATDLGTITDRVDHYMRRAQHIVIESNYDATMLRNGPYPEHLKARITCDRGHLDNADTGQFLRSIYTPMLRNIFLCHLSHDNNLPELATSTVAAALRETGITAIGDGTRSLVADRAPVQLVPFPRFDASPLYTLLAVEPHKSAK